MGFKVQGFRASGLGFRGSGVHGFRAWGCKESRFRVWAFLMRPGFLVRAPVARVAIRAWLDRNPYKEAV